MSSTSLIDPATLRAYSETEFRVFDETPLILRVDVANPGLAALQRAHHTRCSAFITACNPLSRRIGDALNSERQAALCRDLRQASLHFIPGIGQHPSNHWPGEPSFLILGIELESAIQLGVRYRQNAILWSAAAAIPRLILLR